MIYLIPWLLVALALAVARIYPMSLGILFTINVWCLSMPHSFSTFTRSDLRTTNIAIKAILLFLVFFILLNGMMARIGFVTIYSFYFYWQQFHYTKQNMGIGIWRTKDRTPKERYIDYTFYFLISSLSIVASFYGGGIQFFGYSLINPFFIFNLHPYAAIGLNFIALLVYTYLRPAFWKMALTHTLIYTLAYLLLNNFVLGWILLNIFHNSQYLFFMKTEEKNLMVFVYAVLLAAVFYFILHSDMFISLSLAIMLSSNFTHYVFDGFVWKKNFRSKLQKA